MLSKLRREKLKQLREARKTGKNLSSYTDDQDDEIYDEVDDNTFRDHKRKQMLEDDFIVDDNGEGYVDNGIDEWEDGDHYYSENEDNETIKRRKDNKKQSKVIRKTEIKDYFKPTGFNATKEPAKKVDANVDDILEDFLESVPAKTKKKDLSNVFSTIDSETKTGSAKNEKDSINDNTMLDFGVGSERTPPMKYLAAKDVKKEENTTQDGPSVDEIIEDVEDEGDKENIEVKDDQRTTEWNSSPIKDKRSSPEDKMDEDDSDDEVIMSRRPKASAVRPKKESNISAVKATSLSSSPSIPLSPPAANFTEKLDKSKIVDNGESFKFFWLDYFEVDHSLLLFGKTLSQDGNLVSGVVQVNGINKELYFLPREKRLGYEDIPGDDHLTVMDVHEEVIPLLLNQYGLDNIKAKPETKKYAFEVPGIPKEAEYLKVLLPYKTPQNKNLVMPQDIEGETFCRVFGTNKNMFESFVLERNIKGPCWLEVSQGDFSVIQNTSHCQVEVAVTSPRFICALNDSKMKLPPLTMTSISIQTFMNSKQNKQEVASISLATYRNVPQDQPISQHTKPDELCTLIRPINSVAVPPGLAQLAHKQSFPLRTFPNEKAMLNCAAALVKNIDPDVFLGHRMENISLEVLVHRMHDLKVTTWSTFGRRNRKAWPERFGRSSNSGSNNALLIREVFQGRLLCDIANELGQSITPKCQSWDLPEMYEVVCHTKRTFVDVNFQNSRYSDDANFMLMALRENAQNATITAEIGFATQILSLSKQLTNLAGNAWAHTLHGTRAGRNEFILLHEFNGNNYIVPDKEYASQRGSHQHSRNETEEEGSTTVSNKKAKFQGGLVFEPEKGLHKHYILVMDFNSLYPSIIQEFNICFTTVNRDSYNLTHDEENDMPSMPDKESRQGVLPRLLNTLVSRRREVKKLLADPKNTVEERTQYDIKQQALKLTANSMYGCLGYVHSRFYAKPLAMLVTNKGREILMDTRQLAESIGLRVIYGDTDSVMIDTGVDSFAEAMKIGNDFKLHVNERYKLLEIDVDNIFKRLLLHAKKKYAAVNAAIDKKTGQEVHALEVKGLDMRRREYCQLSKDISTYVLEKILSDADPEQSLNEVYSYLEHMAQKIKTNDIPVDRFRINTRLSKDPMNYPNGKLMPPVQVALKLREKGKVVKAGAVLTFVITAPSSENDHSTVAERARPIQDFLNKGSDLRPDAEFYLEKQIFSPVERLIERIEGVDMIRLAKALNIDTRKYEMRLKNESNPAQIAPLESKISDAERFYQCDFLVLECKCGSRFRFGGIIASNKYRVTFNGINCLTCGFDFPLLRITSQLEVTIRAHIALYYAGWLVCDDPACGVTTRQISVYGKRCIGLSGKAHSCKGVMGYRYTSKALYNQLLYFNSIFDVDLAKKNQLKPIYDELYDKNTPRQIPPGQIEALAEQNRQLFGDCRNLVLKYLNDCGRRYVDMGSIFDFMNTSK